jgi:hypothetical protein
MGTGAEVAVPELLAEFGGETLAADAAGATVAAGTGEAAATGLTAGGTLMPAAVAETGESLAAQGLVETGPGVFEALNAPAKAASFGSSVASSLKNAATILTPVASLAASASGISASRKMGAIPKVQGPALMPSAGGPNTIATQRAAVTEQLRRRGRAASILTTPDSDKLGS